MNRRQTRNATKPVLPAPASVTITRIGADADGVGMLPDTTPIYVPFTLPGETLTARPVSKLGGGWLAASDGPSTGSPDRVTPPCVHFGACGGCSLQHWSDDAYRAWKAGLLDAALRRAGFEAPAIAPLVIGQPHSRRRLDLAVRRVGSAIVLGLHRTRSAEVIDLTECPVMHPALFALLPPLRSVLARLQAIRRQASVIVNLLDAGPDLLLSTDAAVTVADRTALTAFASAHGLPRLSWALDGDEPEPICLLRPAEAVLSGVAVRPPPGAFLQASAAAEQAIIDAVLAGLPAKLTAKARIAELYAGCGTLSFALAQRARVSAYEGNAAAVAALRAAAGAVRVEAIQRDLVRQPLSANELGAFAAVVLDPPHAGALEQVTQIAASPVPVVIYVSCNPAALARDARLLREAGYRLDGSTPIDQFLWSARLESVNVLRR